MKLNYDLNLKATTWDEAAISAIVEMHLEANRKAEEQSSVFEDPEPPKPETQRTTKRILKDIKKKFKDQTKFKILCNKIYKLLDGYLKDKRNPLNTFQAILADDYENNLEIMSLLDELFEKQELITELKPKGMMVKINPGAFEGNYVSLKMILERIKDVSLGVGDGTASTIHKAKRDAAKTQKDLTNERVQAMKEAHNRRMGLSGRGPGMRAPPARQVRRPQASPADYGHSMNYPVYHQAGGQQMGQTVQIGGQAAPPPGMVLYRAPDGSLFYAQPGHVSGHHYQGHIPGGSRMF
jgi:hypothetical protein